MLEEARKNMVLKESILSDKASFSKDAIRLVEENNPSEMRPSYFHDIDRIIHAMSFTRYLDKTQVYSYQENDHISKRIVHVQLVSKIARTIARALNLNEDLVEAIALGHDIGHTPLGHEGERILNDISMRELGEYFAHNLQSVRNYLEVENKGHGLNLTVQVLDGIMCHNGEMLSSMYEPMEKTKEVFLEQYYSSYKDIDASKTYHPMTLEGCIVRISDIIAYIGRDVEDAIRLGFFQREYLPTEIITILGSTNKEIINNIILDIIKESMGKPYIKMSDSIYNALNELKKFNYKYIYPTAHTEEDLTFYRMAFNKLFDIYLEDYHKGNESSNFYQKFLNGKDAIYITKNDPKRMVLDFLAGMTDSFFMEEVTKYRITRDK